MIIKKLGEIAVIETSNVDKKSKVNEDAVQLCNFVDVYYNWAITEEMSSSFMKATANNNQIAKFALRKGQVAITKDSETRDDIGVSAYIADTIDNTILGYHCILITPNEQIVLGKYLNAVLHTSYAQKYFEANASGSGQRYTLTNDIVANFPVPIIAIEKQKQIGDIFSNIDSKISLNNSICSDLEAMAKQLYDYWFVQFDFPDENGKPYKSSGGKMVWNEELKREIPDGWDVAPLTSVANIIDCLHSKKPEYCFEKESNYLLSLENITKEGYIDVSKKYYISEKDYKYWTQKVVCSENDFVVTNAGRAGDIGKIPRNIECAIGRNITLIRPVKINVCYLRQFFKSVYMQEQIYSKLDSGSFFSSFNVYAIKEIKILKPASNNYEHFIKKCEPIIAEIEELQEENQQLISLRDFLLPMFMNGQVKIK